MKSTPQFQWVFALDRPTADALADSASRHMPADTHSQHVSDCYYEPADEAKRAKSKFARRQQFRVRRVDRRWDVSLENVSWDGDLRSLRQTTVPSNELVCLDASNIDPAWRGKWFHKKQLKHDLVPSLETRFDRTSWKHQTLDGEIRLTIDRELHAGRIQTSSNRQTACVPSILVRMNFAVSLPATFKALIYEFALLPEQPTVLFDLAKAALAPTSMDAAQAGATFAEPKSRKITSSLFGLRREVTTCQVG
ncbi:VTC domain-containing protein [Rhodopirellula sp. JC639]|uniref:VTC domain-containing protein n=1 Tax=Stieleria mannarensis TaxID=2755585 RepID=UPI001603B156|nr:VTC domain-containing protein [Rhodopirellula sp. JC639]